MKTRDAYGDIVIAEMEEARRQAIEHSGDYIEPTIRRLGRKLGSDEAIKLAFYALADRFIVKTIGLAMRDAREEMIIERPGLAQTISPELIDAVIDRANNALFGDAVTPVQ